MGPHGTHTMNRCSRNTSAFDQYSAGNQTGPAQSSTAMDQDSIAGIKPLMQSCPGQDPCILEPLIGNTHVNDWQMHPIHTIRTYFLFQVFDVK
jgi:hypothetical protein